ncbi:MAG TPA: MFS transporter [Bryobacteraceae bacterium]|nr:MFS transporter [Bryobacteraceae bacterium]
MSRDLRLMSGAAFAGMLVFGIVMALLGAVLPPLSGRLQFSPAGIGTLFLTMNMAMLACSFVVGVVMDRFGMKLPLMAGPLLVAAALALIARAAAFEQLLPAAAALGFGGGALNAATNTLIAYLHHDERRKTSALNLLGVFFGFGALLMPFCVGALLASFGIGTLLMACAALCAVIGVFPAALRFPPPKQKHRLPFAEIPRFVRSPLALAIALLLFFQSGIEFTLGGYIATYLTASISMTVAAASWILAGYWGCVMAARAVLSKVRTGAAPARFILGAAISAAAGAAVAALATSPAVASFGILLSGAALAGIFPTVLGIAGARFQQHSGTVFGILFTIALTGGMLVPWISGNLAAVFGLRWVFGVVAICFLCIAVMSLIVAHLARPSEGKG